MSIRVLYVEDDEDLGVLLRETLAEDAIEITHVRDGETALARLGELRPEVVVLDVGLPGIDGLAVCRVIRTRSAVPVIVVSGGCDADLPVRALDEGADDFIAKPYDRRELTARIRAHVRRARGEVVRYAQRIVLGTLTVDIGRRVVELDGAPIALTSTELSVLAALAQHPGEALTRDRLLQVVHGTDEAAFDRSIDVLVSRLRSKLETDPRRPSFIKTVRKIGYMLDLHRS